MTHLFLSLSADNSAIGFEFKIISQGKKIYFRLPVCADLFLKTKPQSIIADKSDIDYFQENLLINDSEDGFATVDKINPSELVINRTLPNFKFVDDLFYKEQKSKYKSMNWEKYRVDKANEAERFSFALLDHFYESMIIDNINLNNNFNASKIPEKKEKWCHMPWINSNSQGRDAIHGLVKGRNFQESLMYINRFVG